jgi:hypothetical protein
MTNERNATKCDREDELLDALGRGYVPAEIEAHVAGCAACSELRLVAGALLDDRAAAMLEAPIPSAGSMWWRLRVRHRHEAEAAARRSLLIGQAVTLAVAIGLVVAFFGSDLAMFGSDVASTARTVVTAIRWSAPILLGAATWIIGAPIAGWVALRRE